MATTSPSPQLIGPLTTTFIPPSDCSHIAFVSNVPDGINWANGWLGGRLYQTMYSHGSSGLSCLPYGSTTGLGYYSPGICPSGWVIQASTTNGNEYTHNCCPTLVHNRNNGTHTSYSDQQAPLIGCWSSFTPTSGQLITVSVLFPNFTLASLSTQLWPPSSQTTSEISIWAAGIQVRFKDSDFPTSQSITTSDSTSPTTTLFKSPSNSLSTSASTSLPGDERIGSSPTSGLPSSAKIGLGVGISVAFVLLSVLAFLLIRRHRKRVKHTADPSPEHQEQEPEYQHNDKPELPGNDSGNTVFFSGETLKKPELDATTRELLATTIVSDKTIYDTRQTAELGNEPSHNNVAELGDASNEEVTPRTGEIDTASPPFKVKRKEPLLFTSSLERPEPSSPVKLNSDSQNHGPLPGASELYPEIAGTDNTGTHDDEDLAYQERRLQERRELIAEKERLARDEDALRERRAEAKRKSGSRVGSGGPS